MVYGYCRVSTAEQRLDRQVLALERYGTDKLFCEKMTGTKKHRPELDKMLGVLKAGDTVVVESLSRLGRSVKNLAELMDYFNSKGIRLVLEALSKKTETTHEMSVYAECVWQVLVLGHSRLHKLIINKLNEVNAHEFENEVGQYISSLCRMCIYTCLNSGITYIGNNSTENRKEIVGKFKNACLNLMGKAEAVFTGEFQNVSETLIVDLYQKLYNMDKSNLLEYLISTRELVSNFDNTISKTKTKTKNECFVYD